MKKLFLPLMLLLSSPALAQATTIDCQNIDITQYSTAEELQRVQKVCSSPTENSSKVTPETVREWGSLGKEFSTTVVDTAKELGIAVNEFLYTPVGFLIAFYFMWDMIGGILVGIPLLIFIWWLYFRVCRILTKPQQTVEFEYVPYIWGLFSLKRVKNIQYIQNRSIDKWGVAWVLLGAAAAFLSSIVIGVLIF